MRSCLNHKKVFEFYQYLKKFWKQACTQKFLVYKKVFKFLKVCKVREESQQIFEIQKFGKQTHRNFKFKNTRREQTKILNSKAIKNSETMENVGT